MANTTTEVSTSSQANSSSSSPKAAPPAPAESQQRRTIATYAVLVGLTPLIPVPFVDDVVEGALVRRFVGALSASRGVTLSDAEVRALSFGSDGGVFKKIARGVFVYPLKKLFRKTFFFLEGKRVVDLASLTFCRGYLLDVAFERGWAGPGVPGAPVLEAIEKACREAGTSPVEHAVRAAFNGSRAAFAGAVEGLTRAVKRTKGTPDEAAAEAAREASAGAAAPVERKLEETLRAVPAEYFKRLTQAFATALGKSL